MKTMKVIIISLWTFKTIAKLYAEYYICTRVAKDIQVCLELLISIRILISLFCLAMYLFVAVLFIQISVDIFSFKRTISLLFSLTSDCHFTMWSNVVVDDWCVAFKSKLKYYICILVFQVYKLFIYNSKSCLYLFRNG